MIRPDRLAKLLEVGRAALTDADLAELIQAYRLLLSLRDKARSADCDAEALKRALARLGATQDELDSGLFNLNDLFADNEIPRRRRI